MKEIYTKTVTGGTDDCVVLNDKTAWRFPLNIPNDEWNEIQIGLFHSFTGSLTDNNTARVIEQLPGTTPDTFGFMGVARDDNASIYLPDPASSSSDINDMFFGFRHSGFESNYFRSRNLISAMSNRTPTSNSGSANMYLGIGDALDNNFAGYFGIHLKKMGTVSNPDLQVTISSNTAGTAISDVSMSALKSYIDLNVGGTGNDIVQTLPLENASVIVPWPNAFMIYNGFSQNRQRIHSFAVKKIS